MLNSPHQYSIFCGSSSGWSPPAAIPDSIGETKIFYTSAKEILTRATGFMDAYDFTLNPYGGCSFGCTYCYAAFFSHDIEKRDNWGYWVNVKENAVSLLEKRKPGTLDGKLIYMSSVTDPYQPVERQLEITQGLLQTMVNRGDKPKLVVQTRSPDVVRDCDLFRSIEDNGGRVQVNMTVTTDDEDIRRTFEPFCPSSHARLRAIGEVQAEGNRLLHHDDALAAGQRPGRVRRQSARYGGAKIYSPAVPLPAGQVPGGHP